MANQRRDGTKERFWREALARHATSGASVRAFCRQEQFAESAFYAWRQTIAARDGHTLPRKRKSSQSPPPAPLLKPTRAASFVPAVVTDVPARETSILLELAGGRMLRLPVSMTTERLVELVLALETRGRG